MAEEKKPKKIPEPTFEQALERLKMINARFEQGDLPLAEALQLYQEGVALAKQCETRLREAEQLVAKVLEHETGLLKEEPLETEEA